MSPKTATISLALLALTLILTLPSAHSSCPSSSIPEILKHYDLPPSIFPNDVQSFHCDPINKDSVRLNMKLHGVCMVIREALAIKNVLKCVEQISAIISTGKLSDVKGVTVQLYVAGHLLGGLMRITGAERHYIFGIKFLKFTPKQDNKSGNSPLFLYSSFPKEPPKCDSRAAFYFSDDIVADTMSS